MKNNFKEYLRLGRVFNADILGLILIISYLLTTRLYNTQADIRIIIGLFIIGILAHIWGAYNNDRLDLIIDKNAKYCSHKPLVAGNISIKNAMKIEMIILIIFILITIWLSPKITTMVYLFCAVGMAYLYNRYNKSNMFTNVMGQMYASFVVLIGMSIVVDFDFIIFLSAIVLGLNGVYLNIIEADLKDISGDVINVPKALGLEFNSESSVNKTKFYILNEAIKLAMFVLVLGILFIEEVGSFIVITACGIFGINFYIRQSMFSNLSPDREKMKFYITAQELSSILLISMIYVIINPLIPIIILMFIILWFIIWNKYLWGTCFQPQV